MKKQLRPRPPTEARAHANASGGPQQPTRDRVASGVRPNAEARGYLGLRGQAHAVANGVVDAEGANTSGAFARAASYARARKTCPRCGERYPADFRVCPRDAVELQETTAANDDPLVGAVVGGDYELLTCIGEGAMGRVYEARHTRLASKRFAIKVLHGDLTRQPEVVERFLREADSTSQLNHPNIVGVLDVNLVPDGRPYIVAELLEGDQLGAYLDRKGKLGVAEAVNIGRQICKALAAAHHKGIVHRDIKPENVFLVGTGERRLVKVLDFGISRVNDATATLTKTGMVLGTPAYMPPEQATGARIDHRADIYSLGAILYEALTGRRPFVDTDPIATLAAVLTKEPTRPCALNMELPPALELLIQKAMAKKPDERYQSMQELDAALAQFDVPDDTLPMRALPRQHGRIALPSVRMPAVLMRALGSRPGRHIDEARVELVIVTVASVSSVLLALIDVSASVVRLSRGVDTLRYSEMVLAALGAIGVLIAPVLLWAKFLAERVWSRTPRVIATSVSTCRVLFAGLVSFAVCMLLTRVFAGALHAEPSGTAWPGWDVLAVSAGALMAGRVCWSELRSDSLTRPPSVRRR